MPADYDLPTIQPAHRLDSPDLRALFARQLARGQGELIYDQWSPYAQSIQLPGIPEPEVWLAWGRGQVVAAGWYDLLTPTQVRVVALTDAINVDLLDPLLDRIEVAVHGLTRHPERRDLHVAAWLPDTPLRVSMEEIYQRRGWTAEPLWHVPLSGHRINRALLAEVIAAARRQGIEIRPPTPEEQAELDRRPTRTDPVQFAVPRRLIATIGGQPIAMNGIGVSPVRGRVAWVAPEWLGECDEPQLVMDALLAACLELEESGPAELVAPWSVTDFKPWFSAPYVPQVVHRYVRQISRARPTPRPPEYFLE
ncbi:hypothetical protein [uncultured Deinococcus sp.]|uniref:hypothetical protein n=1 Tax=uncultured Deinococcus sp. TaxID=158789 RepID=UPI0025E9C760|nr:hypothetical protein [uncultured Deinococcus sp.]